MSDAPVRWNRFAQLLHWLIALLIVGLGTVGLIMTDLSPSPDKIKVYMLHKSFGITVLMLVALRLVWRLATRHPAPVPGPRWQTLSASVVHFLLYVLMFAIPLSGWLFNSAANFPLQWFGLVRVPALWGPDPTVKHYAREFHETAFWVLITLAVLHAAAAFKHHYFDRDDTLRRMLPRRSKPDRDDSPQRMSPGPKDTNGASS
jgi:cytochrome b561